MQNRCVLVMLCNRAAGLLCCNVEVLLSRFCVVELL